VHWQSLLHDGLQAMRERGDLRPDADLNELSMALLIALQGGTLLGQTLRTAQPMRADATSPSPRGEDGPRVRHHGCGNRGASDQHASRYCDVVVDEGTCGGYCARSSDAELPARDLWA